MDCNQRVVLRLLSALMVCAVGAEGTFAQERLRSTGSAAATNPQATAGSFSQRPQQPAPRSQQSVVEQVKRDSTFSPLIQPQASVHEPPGFDVQSRTPIPLKPRAGAVLENGNGSPNTSNPGSSAGLVLSALVVVLLLLLGLAKLFLKRSPYAINGLPREVIDVLGRRVVDPRNSIYMVKVGGRMVLLGSSPNGLTSLAEISDPIEVAALANICTAAQQPRADAANWLKSLWPRTRDKVESRTFDDQLGERLFEEAQQGESRRVNGLTVGTIRERHRAS
jgi:flagellar biogenesis protein FliO